MRKIILLLSLLLPLFVVGQSDCLLDQEPPNTLVVDQADILTDSQEQQLANELIRFNNETSNQILLVTVNDLCGRDKADFTYSLGEKWKVGQKKFDNGVVIMIKPHGSQGDRHVFIATGYGLEGAIPDAIAKRIVEVEMIPAFKQGDFFNGIVSAVSAIEGLAKGEIDQKSYARKKKKVSIIPFLFILGIAGLLIFSAVRRTQKQALGRDMSFWAALWLLSQSGRRHGGGWNDFHSGGGHFGGGGGFGGFGGGSFGGGGAGGSW